MLESFEELSRCLRPAIVASCNAEEPYKRTKDMDVPIIRQILSFIQVLVVHDKHSESCRWVRQTLPNLRTIIFAPTSGGLCSRMGKERAMEHTKVCGCIPIGQPIHIILMVR